MVPWQTHLRCLEPHSSWAPPPSSDYFVLRVFEQHCDFICLAVFEHAEALGVHTCIPWRLPCAPAGLEVRRKQTVTYDLATFFSFRPRGRLFSILVSFLDCTCHMRLIEPMCLVSAFEMEIEFHLKLTWNMFLLLMILMGSLDSIGVQIVLYRFINLFGQWDVFGVFWNRECIREITSKLPCYCSLYSGNNHLWKRFLHQKELVFDYFVA